MFASLLVANRGEIVCRIFRTAKRLGLRTVAVYSDADAGALHVAAADTALRIGPAPAAESYLNGEAILDAARRSGADAVHPGYGFLSENADFAQAVLDAGLVWVGPKPASIRAMGRKDAAKRLMAAAGVPVTPGYDGADQSPDRLGAEAERIGWPVLIKAVAGGGGKGMRRVEAAEGLAEALASCRREAEAAFGDGRVLLERYIERPRHIEVQVFGDTHGNLVHLFERDCSLQRRHQKVVEEAPAPGMNAATRDSVCAAALRAAGAVDYVGAGTVEFIADAREGLRPERIWFMEMNTRLQVEHPVTEAVTGQDLVEWQLRVAAGEKLPKRQDELALSGWAMEARLYAEDPAKGFLPSVGPLARLRLPENIRVDAGVREGDAVSPFYDPMIAKLIAHAPTREEAARQLAEAARGVEAWPVRTNAGFLARALSHPLFREGAVDTGFIERHPELAGEGKPSDGMLGAAAQALVEAAAPPRAGAWSNLPGFRLNADPVKTVRLGFEGRTLAAEPASSDLNTAALPGGGVLVSEAGESFAFFPARTEGSSTAGAESGTVASPMPGRVASVLAETGQRVTRGQPLLVVEAMKMEHSLLAPFSGRLVELAVSPGAQVRENQVCARVEPLDPE